MFKILSWDPKYKDDFKRLNAEWIEKYFRLEEKDLLSLNDPQETIINKGGDILFLEDEGKIIATCAIMKMDEHTYELAKMAVEPAFQGKGAGKAIAAATIARAKEMGAKKVYLESNRKLIPALKLYEKLGFTEVTGHVSPYERADIQMELIF